MTYTDNDTRALQAIESSDGSPETKLTAHVTMFAKEYLRAVDPLEAEAVALVRELRAAGWTIDDIASEFRKRIQQETSK